MTACQRLSQTQTFEHQDPEPGTCGCFFVSRDVDDCLCCADATKPTNVSRVAFFFTDLEHLQNIYFFLKKCVKKLCTGA